MIDDRAMVGKIAGMFWRFLVADDPEVFDADDAPRMDDIDRFMRKRPAPRQCRREASFKFG
ncbi:hypothetical protein SO694_000056108 [Aureococcus anophagefferens]|uniref:Uncharacterized protein n=1 Tax=Aureococcus anophagefferens TaxID=44056 RepID=A0ABR1GAI8_AURAN